MDTYKEEFEKTKQKGLIGFFLILIILIVISISYFKNYEEFYWTLFVYKDDLYSIEKYQKRYPNGRYFLLANSFKRNATKIYFKDVSEEVSNKMNKMFCSCDGIFDRKEKVSIEEINFNQDTTEAYVIYKKNIDCRYKFGILYLPKSNKCKKMVTYNSDVTTQICISCSEWKLKSIKDVN